MLLRMLEAIPRPVVLLGVIITLLLLIYPDFLIGLFHPSADIREASIRALAGFNAFLLALFSMAGAASFFSPRVPQLKGSLSHPPDVGIGYHEPQKTLLILATLPNFPNSKDILPFLHRACLLANLLPRRIETLDESFALLPHGDILGIIADSAYYDNIFPHVRRTGAILFGLSQAKEFRRTGAGNRIDISLPEAPTEVMLPDFSSVLTAVFSSDTPRGFGFHGNWVGTYGLLVLRQERGMNVTGKYFYGGGEISGQCEIDSSTNSLILRYKWQQRDNRGNIGSTNTGGGAFVMPAGAEILYGYWFIGEDVDTAQNWCASRLSRDISENIRKGGSFGTDFGLSEHSRDSLIGW